MVKLVIMFQIAFAVLEMFLWRTNFGKRISGKIGERSEDPAVWAINQGLYNGFLALGLIWGLVHRNAEFGFELQVFFLGCVLVAGLYGALTVKWTFLLAQALPATVALALLIAGFSQPAPAAP